MPSNKFTKDLSDFGAYNRPGMIYPDMFNHKPAGKGGDSYPGLQYMTQLALSAYGEYHVIDECVPEIDGTNVTGHIGYVMITGNIVEVDTVYKTTLSTNHYLIIENDGGYATTGAAPTGVIIAQNIGGTIYNISRRESKSINYFPTGVVFYGDLYSVKTNASGFDKISSVTGQFEYLDGYSDIIALDNIDMNSYDIKGASDITGNVITCGTLLISNNITIGGTVDGIDVSAIKLNSMPSAANGNIDCSTQAITNVGNVDGVDVAALKADVDGFPDELKNLETRDITSLGNINDVTITNTQWGYLGSSNQDVRTTDNVEFAQITGTQITGAALNIAGNIVVGGNVDGVDVSVLKSTYDTHAGSTTLPHISSTSKTQWDAAYSHISSDGSSHSYIDQSLTQASSPVFAGLRVEGDIRVGEDYDIYDVMNVRADGYVRSLSFMQSPVYRSTSNLRIYASDQSNYYLDMYYYDATWGYIKPYPTNYWYLGSTDQAFRVVTAYTFNDLASFPKKKSVLKEVLNIKNIKDTYKTDYNSLPNELRPINKETGKVEPKGRILGMHISYNTKAIQELYDIIEIQSGLIENLRTRTEVLENVE